MRYGYHQRENLLRYDCQQRENTGFRMFTEVKPGWTGLIFGWVTSRSQPDLEGFLRALWFPPPAKLTPSLIQYAGPH